MSAQVSVTIDRLPGYGGRVDRLVSNRIASRVAAADSTVWGELAQPEASIRLGWVRDPREMLTLIAEVEQVRAELAKSGIHRVVLCGMGGSSLAPEVMAKRDGVGLVILDSTHPDQVAQALGGDLKRTVVVVASKSGTTVETATARAAFEQAFREAGIDPVERVIIVTDPDSPLHRDAESSGHRVFLAAPTVGGRFSALTAFGLVPSTLAGVDTRAIIDEAAEVWSALHRDEDSNPAISLAAGLGGANQDIALLLADETHLPGLGDWIEQLVAESTGKDGKGVLPVVAQAETAPEVALNLHDVVRVSLGASSESGVSDISVSVPLGAQFLLWEYATALLGYLLELNPFDQPDVESAKVAARSLLDAPNLKVTGNGSAEGFELWVGGSSESATTASLTDAWKILTSEIGESGYLAVQLYVNREGFSAAHDVRARLATTIQRPVTIGFGPRFLHSTGQFHKGGTPDGVFLQVEVAAEASVSIPGYPYDFQGLISAQAAGDRAVLVERGRPVLSVRLSSHDQLDSFFDNLTRTS